MKKWLIKYIDPETKENKEIVKLSKNVPFVKGSYSKQCIKFL